MWPDRRFLDLVGIEQPIIQAPMAGATTPALAIAVAEAGGLGSLGCAASSADQVRTDLNLIRQQTDRPVNVNFFCHAPPVENAAHERAWRARLAPYFDELGVPPDTDGGYPIRAPFDTAMCDLMVEMRPRVVSFHFGLPAVAQVGRLKAAGCIVLSSATTVAEARWLEAHGADAVIAQGNEAGGHRGMFLTSDLASQIGTMALVPQVADAVRVPVIAAGGIADARGVAAALCLGAAAVQIGTAYLFCPEARVSPVHMAALRDAASGSTALTNLFTGRPARALVNRLVREIGPISPDAPAFPRATSAVMALRARAEAQGSGDFSSLWAGEAVAMGQQEGAAALTADRAREARALLQRMGAAAVG
jgi:nitronate monooxygenase